MSKYGRGLSYEFACAVKKGMVKEPFVVHDLRTFSASMGWKPSEKYIVSMLANSSSERHSPTYKKYFISEGNGQYKLSDLAKRDC